MNFELDRVKPAIVGLGYVGLPLVLALAKHFDCIGFDIDQNRIKELNQLIDRTGEFERAEFVDSKRILFTHNRADLPAANVFIVAVPTPVDENKNPDLGPLRAATEMIAHCIKQGDVVVYESTVYPGATEEVCIPILEKYSGLKLNQTFFCGYSPERISPGDKKKRLADVVKITSGSTPEAAQFIDSIYQKIIRAGTHKAPSIKVAEAAKAIENTQRDVNIALANELAIIFRRLEIDTEAVLQAAGTKWNFMAVRPGLVGGHCIGVDPYYLIHKAQSVGVYAELITAARRINDRMSEYVSTQLMRLMALRQINIVGAKILILGLAFKENCADLRNTRVVEIISELKRCHADLDVCDPWVDPQETKELFDLELQKSPPNNTYDAILICVGHQQFKEMGEVGMRKLLRNNGIIYDAKYVLPAHASDERL